MSSQAKTKERKQQNKNANFQILLHESQERSGRGGGCWAEGRQSYSFSRTFPSQTKKAPVLFPSVEITFLSLIILPINT